VSGGRIFSLEEMALAAETLSQTRAIAAGLPGCGPRQAPCDAAPAPAGRRPWSREASLMVTEPYREWAAGGRVTARDRAHERVRRILEGHQPPPLDARVDAALRRLAGAA